MFSGPLGLAEKLLLYFVISFFGTFIPAVTSVLEGVAETGDWNTAKAALVSLLVAAFVAGLRAVIALLPILPVDDNIGLSRRQVN